VELDWNSTDLGPSFAGVTNPTQGNTGATVKINAVYGLRDIKDVPDGKGGIIQTTRRSTLWHEMGHANDLYKRKPALELNKVNKEYMVKDAKDREINGQEAIRFEKRFFERAGAKKTRDVHP
jgi:hypothetical protein